MFQVHRSGMTRTDLAAGVACGAVIIALGTVAQGQHEALKAVDNPKTVIDATQLVEIHKAMLVYANESEGIFPTPGLIDRQPLAEGVELPGRGPEDYSANTTANLYSALACQRFISPEVLISPVERNPNVKLDADYNFDAYNPENDTYWDSTFAADLMTASNVSYAHTPIADKRKLTQWRSHMDHHIAQLGNRGPEDGAIDYDSITCGPHGNWAGNIVFGDNHAEFFMTTAPEKLKSDNLFAADEGHELDALIAFTKLIKDGQAELQFD